MARIIFKAELRNEIVRAKITTKASRINTSLEVPTVNQKVYLELFQLQASQQNFTNVNL